MEQEKRIAVVIDPHLVERNPRCRKDNFFEAALGKLEYLAQNNDYVVIAGDLFHIHSNSTWFFNVVYSLFKNIRESFMLFREIMMCFTVTYLHWIRQP